MGKGGGCTPSSMKKKPPTADEKDEVNPSAAAPAPMPPVQSNSAEVPPPINEAVPPPQDKPPVEAPPTIVEEKPYSEAKRNEDVLPSAAESATVGEEIKTTTYEMPTTKVYVIYYSMYGHVARLAEKVKEGVDAVDGTEGILYQVPETLPEGVLAKMGAPPKADIPVIRPEQLADADGIIFGIPTRFGMMCSQMKAFFDATGKLWQSQALAGKPAGFFFSTGTQGGGQETTALTAISQLAHHGMLFVPIGYTSPAAFAPEVHGGSPYGAGTYAGDGSREPEKVELEIAVHQGKLIGAFSAKLKKGALMEE